MVVNVHWAGHTTLISLACLEEIAGIFLYHYQSMSCNGVAISKQILLWNTVNYLWGSLKMWRPLYSCLILSQGKSDSIFNNLVKFTCIK